MLTTPSSNALAADVAREVMPPPSADETRSAGCEGDYSLMRPVPRSCLGVIDTDRPHQTDTPHLVPAGHLQVESAVVALALGGTLAASGAPRSARLVLLEDAYKVGVTPRLDVEILFKHAEVEMAERSFASPGPLGVRAKIAVVPQAGILPAVSFVPWVFLPVARPQPFRASPLVFWEWELPLRFELEMNAGAMFGAAPAPAAALVAASALTWTIAGEVRTFADIYATGLDVALGTGALWAFTRDMQIDVGTYVGLNGRESRATPFVGFSVRQ